MILFNSRERHFTSPPKRLHPRHARENIRAETVRQEQGIQHQYRSELAPGTRKRVCPASRSVLEGREGPAPERSARQGTGRFFDACPIIKLYRDSLELFLKAILLGPGADLVNPSPSRKQVIEANHGLTKLLPDAHRIFALCGWEDAFGGKTVATFDDFEAIVNEARESRPTLRSLPLSNQEGSYRLRR